jgi:hypothetical protein
MFQDAVRNAETLALRRLDRLIWAMVALVAGIVLSAPLVSSFRIEWHAFAAPALACAMLVAAGQFYRRWRTDPRLASGLDCTAQVVAFAAVGAPLSYLAASANLPLYDHWLDVLDRALWFDWKGMLSWMNDTPAVYTVLRPIYLSLTLQMTTVVLCLAFTGRLLWLRVYTLAFIFAALVSIAVSALLPAAGAWPYYGMTAADSPNVMPAVSESWPVFYGLRDGSFRSLVAVGSQGIITFPSLHAGLGVILMAGAWPVPILRWVFVVLNLVMLAATPIDGSHYLIDVWAGILMAVLCLMAARALAVRAGTNRSPAPIAAAKIASTTAGN